MQRSILPKVYGKRDPWVHKGRYGRLALICGSERHTGSACFAGMSAYRAGADLVYVIAPERAADVAANFSPVLMTTPLPGPSLTRRHENTVLGVLREVKATAAVVGPGLWREKETLRAITRLVSRIRIPMVLDADAIRGVGTEAKAEVAKLCLYPPRRGVQGTHRGECGPGSQYSDSKSSAGSSKATGSYTSQRACRRNL